MSINAHEAIAIKIAISFLRKNMGLRQFCVRSQFDVIPS